MKIIYIFGFLILIIVGFIVYYLLKIPEGFIAAPTTYTQSYQIINLEYIYTQYYTAQNDFPIRSMIISEAEKSNIAAAKTISNFTPNFYPFSNDYTIPPTTTSDTERLFSGYLLVYNDTAFFKQNHETYTKTVSPYIWNYYPGINLLGVNSASNPITSEAYQNLLIVEIQNYYNSLLLTFQTHPIAFILKNVPGIPSLLNNFQKIIPPNPTLYTFGSITKNPAWQYNSKGPGNGGYIDLTCIDDTRNVNFNMGFGDNQNGNTLLYSAYVRTPKGDWCEYSWGAIGHKSQAVYAPWSLNWIITYYRNRKDLDSSNYSPIDFKAQTQFENNYSYNNNIFTDDNWAPKIFNYTESSVSSSIKDLASKYFAYNSKIISTINADPLNLGKYKTIQCAGNTKISSECFNEIKLSISYTVSFNFTDLSTIERQIRISSEAPYNLYMSKDASALAEYSLESQSGNLVIKAVNNSYNNIKCNILLTPEIFSLLPFHTRNIISNWAVQRYNRVLRSVRNETSSSYNVFANSGYRQPTSQNLGGQLLNTNIYGAFFDTSINDAPKPTDGSGQANRQAILANIAQIYYNNQLALEEESGNVKKGSQPGQSFITKFLDVFMIGTTILDIRFEEQQKRSSEFVKALIQLNTDYKRYTSINLSKDDMRNIEKTYIQQKRKLYADDNANIWGSAKSCGYPARYVEISLDDSKVFNLSQIVVIDNTGTNVALGAMVYGPPWLDFGLNDPGTPAILNADQTIKTPASASPNQIMYDYKGNVLSDNASAPDNIPNKLSQTIIQKKETLIQITQQLLTDGTMTSRWFPNVYRTVAAPSSYSPPSYTLFNYRYIPFIPPPVLVRTNRIVVDLGSTQQVAAVRLILPYDVNISDNTFPSYTVNLLNSNQVKINTTNNIASVPTAYQNSSIIPDYNPRTLIVVFPGQGDDAGICPNFAYNRYVVARFYLDPQKDSTGNRYPITDMRYWNVSGYTVGTDAALTFNPKYNAGINVDLTSGSGNFVYKPPPNFSLNKPITLNCGNPDQVRTIFNDYNIFVNNPTFLTNPNVVVLTQPENKLYRADTVYGYNQIDDNTCGYYWSDKAINDIPNRVQTVDKETYYRIGTFNYVNNTEDWDSQDRTFMIDNTIINPGPNISSIQTVSGVPSKFNVGSYSFLSFNTDSNGNPNYITLANPYISSTTLDTASGFCPALPCSDPIVIQSIIDAYNTHASSQGSSGSWPLVSKVCKAVTPTNNQCQYLVETVNDHVASGSHGSTNCSNGKTLSLIIQVIPPIENNTCVWRPLFPSDHNPWDPANSPDMIPSVPFLTRIYNYASDVMAPFASVVTSSVSKLTSMGNAQLDPNGSGIVNALIQYRKKTNAAAGDIRYFNETDEFRNKCGDLSKFLAVGSDVTVSQTAKFPRCKSQNLIMNLLEYYSLNNQGSFINSVLGAGQTTDNKCDYTFVTETAWHGGGGSNTQTTGLRCSVSRIPFSCEHKINSCSYVNPTPPVSDLLTFPSRGSGSTFIAGRGSGSYPITAADPSEKDNIPQPPGNPLESIDWVKCSSLYAESYTGKTGLSNTDAITCSDGTKFFKISPNYLFVTGTIPTSLPPYTGTITNLLNLVPFANLIVETTPLQSSTTGVYTVATGPTNIYEYRITEKDNLPFNLTYVHAEYYTDSNGNPQLYVLRPSNSQESPNSFLNKAGTLNYNELANQFINFWNGLFSKAGNTGNIIGEITGYKTNYVNDSIIFYATSADYGPLNGYDILEYYAEVTYEVNFRIPFASVSDSSKSVTTTIYMTNPPPGTPPLSTTIPNPKNLKVSIKDFNSTSPYSVINPILLINNLHYVRYLKFIVRSTNGTYGHVEITRMAFYSSISSGYKQTDVTGSNVTVEGIYASYYLPPSESICNGSQYNLVKDPVTYLQICQVINPDSYTPVSDTACGIGYINNPNNSSQCISNGFFQELLDLNSLFTGNQYTPRLRIMPSGSGYKYIQIDLNDVKPVDAFSFITGSQNTLPLTWILQGSINGTLWLPLHQQTQAFDYTHYKGGTTTVRSNAFYNPGIFPFNTSGGLNMPPQLNSLNDNGNDVAVEGFKIAPISSSNPTMVFKETFIAPIESSYILPLAAKMQAPNPKFQQLEFKPRIQLLRFQILETQDEDSPFVHMSRLEFHTKSGIIPSECIRISNPHGSRRSGKDGPNSLLADDRTRRWVDYNKSDLLIQFNTDILPEDHINGFRFHVPQEEGIGGLPAKWKLEGSYDRRNWFPLHLKEEKARIVGNASPIYKFLETV